MKRAWLVLCLSFLAGCSQSSGADASTDVATVIDTGTDASSPVDVLADSGNATDVVTMEDTGNAIDGGPAPDVFVPDDVPAGQCNALAPTGAFVTPRIVATATPTGTGGTIIAGNYVLSDLVIYEPDAGGLSIPPTRAVATVTSGAFDTAAESQGQGTNWQNSNYTVTGTTLHLTVTCPTPQSQDATYTATSSMLTLYSDPIALVFTLH